MGNRMKVGEDLQTLEVALGDRSYPIYIGTGLLGRPELVAPHRGNGRLVVVTNETVAPLYLEQTRTLFGDAQLKAIVISDGEAFKNLEIISHIYDELMQGKYDRNTTLVALGGGVVGDITGFAAATYQRGIPFIQIPTTLLAQVDSSVGGKTGVNHPLGKNMIGAFYQPQCVVIDTRVLNTLPEREIKAGLAEVIKYGLICDAEFFDWLAVNSDAILRLDPELLSVAIRKCCQTKANIVAEDEREAGRRALLNLGHTFGHAIETACGYGRLLHGETVAIGMVMAADLSCRLGWLEKAQARQIRQVIEENFGMPVVPPADISTEQFLDLMASDKKADQGRIRFILLRNIGDAEIEGDVPQELLLETLQAGEQLCR